MKWHDENKILFAILLFFAGLAHAGDFKCTMVSMLSSGGRSIAIVPGRNDGINRLYVTGGRRPYEFTWNGSNWTMDSLCSQVIYPKSLAAGFGRNDSLYRLYYGKLMSGKIYEFTYNGATWDSVLVKNENDKYMYSLAIGNIKNDDSLRLIAGSADSTTLAFTYDKLANAWQVDTLGIKRRAVLHVTIGKGRNDDTNRVYSSGDGFWVEYTYRNGWDSASFVDYIITGMLVADAKNDGVKKLYISKDDAGLYEYLWDLSDWMCTDTIDTLGAWYPISGDGHNDGKQRIYAMSYSMCIDDSLFSKIHVFEYSYNGYEWTKDTLDTIAFNYGVNFFMSALAVGDARNDGKNRVYGVSELGHIFEWEWDDSLNGVEQEDLKVVNDLKVRKVLKVKPNPFYSYTAISNLPSDVELKIYDITGRLVEKTNSTKVGAKLKTGVYFVTAGGYKPAKMVKIK